MDRRVCDRARLARDARFDGLFFVGVLSTGIYCRPICPARPPKPENVVYFPTAAAAADAGLRPCLRCRPEAAPGSPAWNATSDRVSRAMLLIREGALDEGNLEDLALTLGVGSRHLRRVFQVQLGASPKTLATTQKILFAKKLLDETRLSITDIAFASGFGSIRRFNAGFTKVYGKTPSAMRGRVESCSTDRAAPFQCTLSLSYRPPFDWARMLGFFEARAIPGVEWVNHGAYHRTIRLNDTTGTICVTHAARAHALQLTMALSDNRDLMVVVERVRRMFDLDANLGAIHEVLTMDPLLKKIVKKHQGLRLPGTWDPFEIAVRAVVGQQISVKGARTLAGRIAAMTGPQCDVPGQLPLSVFFPTAQELTSQNLDGIGMPAKRIATIKALSRLVADRGLHVFANAPIDEFTARVTRIPGIGDWTAHYIAMRAWGEPDAFPAGDLGILRALQQGERRLTPKQVRERAENWRPWRAYAAIHLWHA